MTAVRSFVRTFASALDEVRSRTALLGATRVGSGVRVFGWPRIVCDGELLIGRGVAIISTPAAIEFLVAPGGSMVIGDGALIESGATLRACGRIVVGAGVRIGVGCVVDDHGAESKKISIQDNAWIEDGAVLLGGAHIPSGAVVPRGTTVHQDALTMVPTREREIRPDIEHRLREVLERVVVGTRGAGKYADLSHVKGWDSLAALRVLVALEKEFGVALSAELLAKSPTLESIATGLGDPG